MNILIDYTSVLFTVFYIIQIWDFKQKYVLQTYRVKTELVPVVTSTNLFDVAHKKKVISKISCLKYIDFVWILGFILFRKNLI